MTIIRSLAQDGAAPFATAWYSFKAYRTHQVAKAELMALDDHMLKDIGLDRSEIESALVDTAHERRSSAALPRSKRPAAEQTASKPPARSKNSSLMPLHQ